jgi:hypothetical protein
MQQDLTIYQPPERMSLEQAISAWLDEKRADSARTANAYEETLNDFRDTLRSAGFDLDSSPALVAPLAQGWGQVEQARRYHSHSNDIQSAPLNCVELLQVRHHL